MFGVELTQIDHIEDSSYDENVDLLGPKKLILNVSEKIRNKKQREALISRVGVINISF